MSDITQTRARFIELYDRLKDELKNDADVEFTEEMRRKLDEILDYNVPRGKLNRGLAVIETFQGINGGELSDEQVSLAFVLGWCLEWLQACLLVLDDIMDNSQTRRGRICWYKQPEVGYQTSLGQMLDLIVTHEGENNLSKYTMNAYRRIVVYKTSYYSFYLPIACALILSGEELAKYNGMKDILLEMGIYFQVRDDYLDCFGDPCVMGKIGTDIEDHKCSWLIVQAIELANADQLKILNENYGKSDPTCVLKVKKIYQELDLQSLFLKYEASSIENLLSAIEAQPDLTIQKILKCLLEKIYQRKK